MGALGIIQNMPDTEVIPEFPEWQDQYVGMEAKLKEVPKIPDEMVFSRLNLRWNQTLKGPS